MLWSHKCVSCASSTACSLTTALMARECCDTSLSGLLLALAVAVVTAKALLV